MHGLTKDELQYLRDLARLDAICLGMLEPTFGVKEPNKTRDRLAERGMIRITTETVSWGAHGVELTTKGLRTLQRVERIAARV